MKLLFQSTLISTLSGLDQKIFVAKVFVQGFHTQVIRQRSLLHLDEH